MRVLAAIANALPEGKAPKEIVYIPEGSHDICPLVDGKARRITVKMLPEQGESIAAQFQADLEERKKATVRPWMDFDHKGGVASAIPSAFRYEKGKGLILALDWTKRGREAVEGREYSYHSPEFALGEDGVPAGLLDRGPVGALVNEPAFREIPRIAASDAAEPQNTLMDHKILAKCGLLTDAEAAKDNALDVATNKVKAMDGKGSEVETLKEKVKKLEEQLAEANKGKEDAVKEKATSLVSAAVADGRICAKDEDTKAFWSERLQSGDEKAIKAFDKLPKLHEGLDKPIVVTAGDQAKRGDNSKRRIAAQDQAKKELGETAGFDSVWSRASEIDPEAFKD